MCVTQLLLQKPNINIRYVNWEDNKTKKEISIKNTNLFSKIKMLIFMGNINGLIS